MTTIKLMDFPIPISNITLLELYYYDKLWCEGMVLFEELSEKRLYYLLYSECFEMFVNSDRAKELQLEMLAKLN